MDKTEVDPFPLSRATEADPYIMLTYQSAVLGKFKLCRGTFLTGACSPEEVGPG